MRKLGLTVLLFGFAFVPQAALSQDGPSSADEYVCALTGECGEQDASIQFRPALRKMPCEFEQGRSA